MSVPGPIRLEVPDLVDAVPGGPFEFEVRLTHLASHDTSVLVRVVGALVGLEPARIVDLPAGVAVTTAVRMALPDGMSPGRHLVVVEVVERTVGQVVEASEVAVAIARTRGVTITMTPAMVSKRRGGKFTALIRNHDDVEQRLKLKPLADRPGMALVLGSDNIVLAPGESVTVSGRLKMKGFWLGKLRERWFTLLGDTSGASVYGRGLVMQKPIIGRSVTTLVGLVAVLAVWLGGTLVVMRLLDPVTDDAATEAGAAVDDGPAKPTIPFGDGETRATITVSGAVTAQPDGSGVTVLYRPVTLADTTLSEGKATPATDETEVAGLRTETNADGEFEVAGLDASGIFEFRFAKPGHNTLTQLVQPNGADAVIEVTLEVGSGVISGTVVGPFGGPRGGVLVTLSDGAITYTTSTPSTGDTVGQFTFNNLSTPGTYVLDARATGFGLASTVIELDSGGVRQDVVLEVSPDIGVMSGRVSSVAFESLASTNRLPVKGVMITATDGTVTRTTSTLSEGDLAGTFRLVGLPLNRTYTVTYEGAGWSTRTELVDFGLATEPLDVSLIPSTGRLRGTLSTPPDTVLPSAVAITLASPENTYKSTDAISADGDLLMTGIVPGTYVAVFQTLGLADQVRDVTISAGQTSRLEVDMKAPVSGLGVGTVAVAVVDAASLEPLTVDVTMRFRTSACGTVAGLAAGTCTWNASGGALTITNLEPGAYTLRFTAVGYRPDLITVQAIPGQTVPIEMALQPLGSVQGVVQDADGGALQGVNLVLYEALPDDTPGALVAVTKVNDKGEYRFRRVMFSQNYVLSATLSGYNSITRPITGAVASTVNLDITLRSDSQIAGQVQTLDLVTGQTDPVSLDQFTVFLRTGTASAWVDLLPEGLVRILGGYRFGVSPNRVEGVTLSASAGYEVCIQKNLTRVFDSARCGVAGPEEVQIFNDNGQGIGIRQGELQIISATFTPFPASVSGVIRLPTGATVPKDITVELRRVDFDNKVLDTFTTVTDDGGRFGFENMAPTTQISGFKPPDPQPLGDGTATATGSASSWRIQVRSESGSYNGLRFDLGPNAKYDMDIRMLEGTGRLEFFMMDDFGDPIENAVVFVMRTTIGAQNITYQDLRYQDANSASLCASLPVPADTALSNGVPLSGCTDSSGSIKFDIVPAPVQYYVAIGMSDKNGFAELLKQVVPIRVNIDATEARSLRVSWYYGDAQVTVASADTDRVTTASLSALTRLNPPRLTVTYELVATTGATPVPVDNSVPCYREDIYTWLGQTGTVGLTENGQCFLNDLRPGTYRITALLTDPDLQKVLQTTTSALAIIQPGRTKATVPIRIPVIQRELQVQVLDGAANVTLSGATVVVNSAGQPPTAVKATGADGIAMFSSTSNEMPPPGVVFVTVGFPGFATTSASVNVRSGEQQTLTISLATTIAEARVAVVDTDGVPLSGATVQLDGASVTEAGCLVPVAGLYCLRGAPGGVGSVVVAKAGYQTMTVPIAVANPGGGSVTVMLRALKGTLFVDAVDAATGAEVGLGAGTVSIVDQGSLVYDTVTKTFRGVSPGVVRIVVAAQGPFAAVTVSASVVAGATASATVRLNRGAEGLVVTVVDTLGNAIGGATVTAGLSGVLSLCPGGVVNRYCLTSATPGVVSVSASKPGFTTVLLFTSVTGEGTGSISLVLRQLTGNVLVNVVSAVTGASVAVSSSNVTISATTDPCVATGTVGQCRFDGLASGSYTVVVSGVAGFLDATVSAGAPLDGMTGVVNVALTPTSGQVEVLVLGPSGNAVSGALVTVGAVALVGGGAGRYSGNVPVGLTTVRVEAVGFLLAEEPLAVSATGGSVTVVLNQLSASLRVRVVDQLGTVVPSPTVQAEVGGTVVNLSATGDLWSGLVPVGLAAVTASAQGYTTVQVLAQVTSDGGATTVVLRKVSGNLLVSLADEATGLPIDFVQQLASVTLGASSPPCEFYDTGRCIFRNVPSGIVDVRIVGLIGYRDATASASVLIGGQTTVVALRLGVVTVEAGGLTLVLTDSATGQAVTAGVSITASNSAASSVVSAGPTQATGRYSLTSLVPGLWTVTVSAEGFVTRQLTLQVQNGSTPDVIVDLASRYYSLTGSVVASAGGSALSALSGATVTLSGASTATTTTDALGRYTFANVAAGTYNVAVEAVWANANGYNFTASSSASVTIVAGAATVTRDLTVDARPGAVEATIRAATGAPVDGVEVWIDVNRNGVRNAGESVTSTVNGVATVSSIPAGVYDVVISDPLNRFATLSALVMIERDRTATPTFRLATWGVTVNVGVEIVPIAGLTGSPVSMVVKLEPQAGGTGYSGSTVSNGATAYVSIMSVPAGTYNVLLSTNGVDFVGAQGTVTVSGVPYRVPELAPVSVGQFGFDIDVGVVSLSRATVDVVFSVVDRNAAPVNGALLSITGDTLLVQRTAFVTESGQVVVRLPAAASFAVAATLTGYVSTTGALTVGSAPGTYAVTLLPRDAVLNVVAVDAASPSTVLPNPTVWVVDVASGASHGGFSQALYAGVYRVTVSVVGYVDFVTSLTLAPGEQRLLTAPMTSNAPGGVVVSLRSTFGATVAAVPSSIFLVGSNGASRTDCTVQPDNSTCAFTNVPAGPYSVTVSAAGYSGFESIAVSTGTTTSATVVVNFTATASFTVTGSGNALADASVTIDGTGLSCVTNVDGQCSIPGLDPGTAQFVTVTRSSNSAVRQVLAGWTSGTRNYEIVMGP